MKQKCEASVVGPNGPVETLVDTNQVIDMSGPINLGTQLPAGGVFVIPTKSRSLECSSEGSLSESDGSGSKQTYDDLETCSGADEGLVTGVGLPQSSLVASRPVEDCLDMVLHCPATPMTMGISPSSKGLAIETGNLPMMVFWGPEKEEECSPIFCEPLCQLNPPGFPTLGVEEITVGSEVEISQKSKRVDRHMSGFSKFVGFPIDEFEEECLALFHRIEAS